MATNKMIMFFLTTMAIYNKKLSASCSRFQWLDFSFCLCPQYLLTISQKTQKPLYSVVQETLTTG